MKPVGSPVLLVVVDTEEEFDWGAPFSRKNVRTHSILAQDAAHEIFDDFGIVPTYVVDYPVAFDDRASDYLKALSTAGRAHIGAHLQPWVNPPHSEEVNTFNSYHCNLPEELERLKLRALTDLICERFGERPTIFKGGRYAHSPRTVGLLAEFGYKVDCSVVPFTDFSRRQGPSFLGFPDQPYWLDDSARLLEVPLTTGFFGWAATLGPSMQGLFDFPLARQTHLIGAMARSGFLSRSRLSPEGVSSAEQCRLLETLVANGRKVFSLTYHSPSLAPGNTPYVRTPADLRLFLENLRSVLSYFHTVLGGRFTSLPELYEGYAADLTSDAGDGSD